MRAALTLAAVIAAVLMMDRVETAALAAAGIDRTGALLPRAAAGFVAFLCGALPFVAVELMQGGLRRPARYLRPLAIWAAFFLMANAVALIAGWIRGETGLERAAGWIAIPAAGELLLYILLIDFFSYWFHRAEHASRLLWSVHCTHHAIEELNAVNSYGHWLEGVFRFAFVFLPVSLLVPAPDVHASAVAVIWGTWTIYSHSDAPALRLPRAARWLLIDNLAHHYHHGRERRLHDCNFGFVLSVWDRIFGTWVEPQGDAFPATGLERVRPPRNPADYLMHPLGARRR